MPRLAHHNPNAAPARTPKQAGVRRSRRDWLAGTLVELDQPAGTITVRVESANRLVAVPYGEITIDVAAARVRATDGDGDGRPGLTDLFPGDRVHVVLRTRRGRRPVASHVRQRSGGGPPGGLRRVWHPGGVK